MIIKVCLTALTRGDERWRIIVLLIDSDADCWNPTLWRPFATGDRVRKRMACLHVASFCIILLQSNHIKTISIRFYKFHGKTHKLTKSSPAHAVDVPRFVPSFQEAKRWMFPADPPLDLPTWRAVGLFGSVFRRAVDRSMKRISTKLFRCELLPFGSFWLVRSWPIPIWMITILLDWSSKVGWQFLSQRTEPPLDQQSNAIHHQQEVQEVSDSIKLMMVACDGWFGVDGCSKI